MNIRYVLVIICVVKENTKFLNNKILQKFVFLNSPCMNVKSKYVSRYLKKIRK